MGDNNSKQNNEVYYGGANPSINFTDSSGKEIKITDVYLNKQENNFTPINGEISCNNEKYTWHR